MNLSSLNFRLSANIKPFRTGLNKAERSMDKLGRKMQKTGKNLSMKLTAPIAALGAMSFSVFKGFEAEMSKVKAVSGATAEEFKMLSDNAKELGASTMFSARQVAGLQTEFAKLGFTATEITKVTESTLNLAQAAGSDLARAAMVAGSTLRAFGLDASQTGMVTDVMAKSFSTSAMDMETFAESMKFVAPVAKSAGMSIQETSAMLAVLANAGIKGSQAGTALRRIISEIGGSSKPTAEALKDLAAQGLNLADAKDEVGRSAQSALLVLAGGVDQIAPLTQSFKNSGGAAKEMADIMGDTAFGASKRLESAMEGLGISIGEIVAVALVPIIEAIAKFAGWLNKTSKETKTTIVVFAGLVAAIGPLMFITGGVIRNFKVLRFAMIKSNTITKIATVLQRAYNLALKANPIGIVVTALAALGTALFLVNKRKKETVSIEKKLTDGANEEIAKTKVRQLQANKLIETIKDQNISNEQRSRLIKRLNTEYKDFLPNLIDEKSNIQDITTAQRDMNKEMARKIVMIAAQDQLAEASERAVEAMKRMQPAQKRLDDAMIAYKNSTGETITAQEALRISTSEFTHPFHSLAQEVSNAYGEFEMYSTIVEGSQMEMASISETIDGVSESLMGVSSETSNATDAMSDYAKMMQRVNAISDKRAAARMGDIDEMPFENFADDDNEEADNFVPEGGFENLQKGYAKTRLAAMELSEGISNAMSAAATDTIIGMAQIGGAILAGEATFKDMGMFILSQFATLLSQLGEMFIKYGMALQGFKMATITMNPMLAIAAGVALIGAGSAIHAKMNSMAEGGIPAMAEGGIVTGPTLALIGEGRESEAVIPLSKLNAMMDGGGSNRVEVVGKISGADILLSNERASRNRTRQRGF